MIIEGLVALIVQAGSGLEAITASRLFPVALPENYGANLAAAPAITYQIVGGRSDPSLNNSGPQRWRIQFDCFGATYAAAIHVREALRELLNGFNGVLPDGSLVSSILWIQPIDYFQSAARQYRCSCEFYVNFNFAPPAPYTYVPPSTGAAAPSIDLSSDCNGARVTFTLPAAAALYLVFWNKGFLAPGADISITGNTFTFLGGIVPQSGDELYAQGSN